MGLQDLGSTKPDGTLVKLTNPAKLHQLGWKHKVALEDGIKRMYKWYELRDMEKNNHPMK